MDTIPRPAHPLVLAGDSPDGRARSPRPSSLGFAQSSERETGERVVLGRESELDALRRFVAEIPAGPSTLLLEGSAGIGKTTLWLEAAAMARQTGFRILTTRASESEARLSYAGLSDLLTDVTEDAFDALPPPQRHALETALLRTATRGSPPDQRAVLLAALTVVRGLAASEPLVIAIDDVQWLDAPTARVLSFVLRRLSREPVAVIAALRIGSGSAGDPIDLERAMPTLTRLQVGPMAEDPLGRLMRERADVDLPHPAVVRLHRASHGNPLFALEIARAVARAGVRPDPGSPLPVPEDLQQLLSARLATLPASSSVPLLAIAAASQPTAGLVLAASPSAADARDGLAAAEVAGVIERVDGRVRFSHPLLGSTVYVNAPVHERRSIHLRLASLVEDPEERARHLALAAEGPDAGVAEALDHAARFARSRGAPDAAAELAELANRLTPSRDGTGSRRRSLEAAEYHFDAGDASRALEILTEAIEYEHPGPARAEMLFRLSAMSWMNLIDGVREPAERAMREAGEDREVRSGLHVSLAWVAFYLGDLADAAEHARRSARDAEHVTEPAIKADALATLGFIEFVSGTPGSDRIREAIDLQDQMMAQGSWTEASVYTTPRSILGLELMWAGRLEEARSIFQRELAEYEKHAMYTVRQEVLCYLAELECRAGRYGIAAELAAEAMETVLESGQTTTQSHVALFNQALAATYLGQVDDARSWATEGLRLALTNDDAFNANWNRAVLGLLDVSLGNAEQAHEHLAPAVRYLEQMDAAEPAIIPCVPDEVEALVALGRLEEAESLAERLERQGKALDRPWALGAAWRGRGLIAAARRDLETAEAAIGHALEEHARTSQPFERARSLLILGQIQRRRKQKRVSRTSLEAARDTFATLGAPLWVERAQSELDRIGGRQPSPLELTPSERTVAELVGEGRTNREVADALFMSPSTVQAHLKRIYRKLGVRSRTELAASIDHAKTAD
jgi:DNA-binding CsgD family transcriptional regulator/exonuclease VII small subunit